MNPGPLDPIRAHVARLIGMFRTTSAGSPTEIMRSIGEQRTAAEETSKALSALPKRTLRKLTATTVRCPGNELLVRVVRIPASMPGVAYDTHLVMPKTAAVTYRDYPDIPQRPWFLGEHDLSYRLRCRCHPQPVTLTPGQLRGESPPPPGVRVLKS